MTREWVRVPTHTNVRASRVHALLLPVRRAINHVEVFSPEPGASASMSWSQFKRHRGVAAENVFAKYCAARRRLISARASNVPWPRQLPYNNIMTCCDTLRVRDASGLQNPQAHNAVYYRGVLFRGRTELTGSRDTVEGPNDFGRTAADNMRFEPVRRYVYIVTEMASSERVFLMWTCLQKLTTWAPAVNYVYWKNCRLEHYYAVCGLCD